MIRERHYIVLKSEGGGKKCEIYPSLFSKFSYLSINFKKSCIVGFCVNEKFIYHMVAICKCKIGELPFNYLGIPIGADPREVSTWNEVVEKFRRKLSGWKSHTLSWAARVVLINAVLSALPIYFMSIFQAPATVIKRIDRIRRNFLWGSINGKRKMARISWKKKLYAKGEWRYGSGGSFS